MSRHFRVGSRVSAVVVDDGREHDPLRAWLIDAGAAVRDTASLRSAELRRRTGVKTKQLTCDACWCLPVASRSCRCPTTRKLASSTTSGASVPAAFG
jgi:hypothetical protein